MALSDAGRHVLVLDAGDRIEPGKMDVFEALAERDPEEWSPRLARLARGTFPVDLKHVPLKPAFGSLFAYARDDDDLPIGLDNAETLPSLAYGGLSNCWGAAILPFRERDIADWPISLAELEPHYRAVLRFVPIAAEHDELAEILPLYRDAPSALRRSPQTAKVLRHLRKHRVALSAAGFHFGASRLAVVAAAEQQRACRYSGMCLYGCPYGAVYNAADTLTDLMRDGKIDYRGGVYVDRVTEVDDGVRIDFHRRGHTGDGGWLFASRVFVACGAISSTRLMLESMGCAHVKRRLHDSQYFVVPLLTMHAAKVNVANQGNTLAQMFVELDDRAIAERTMHLQLYGYNDIMLAALARRLSRDPATLERLLQPLLGRVVVAQGYLHSADSPGLTLRCEDGRVGVTGDDGALGAERVKKFVRRLAVSARLLGMLPIPGFVQVGRPGKSNHIGGSLPMREEPGEMETDTLGRPLGWGRVHVVDAAIFPSLPATTVTLSVMANAHRIACMASERMI
jgi:choline dehydrogenase-like flavoprotein